MSATWRAKKGCVGATDIQWQCDRRTAVLLDPFGGLQAAVAVAVVGQDHPDAALRDLEGRALPDAGTPAGDHSYLHDRVNLLERLEQVLVQ